MLGDESRWACAGDPSGTWAGGRARGEGPQQAGLCQCASVSFACLVNGLSNVPIAGWGDWEWGPVTGIRDRPVH